MTRITYVNGQFLNEEDARISIFDRGVLFGDAVYEVSAVIGGKLIDNEAHLARLDRSLGLLEMRAPMDPEQLTGLQHELIRRNRLSEGILYLQISRGVADRDFSYPEDAQPSLIMFTQTKQLVDNPKAKTGIRIVTRPDMRWKRRDIKTVNLLPAAMAKHEATRAGVDDTWMVEDGFITEGTSSNAFIVTPDNKIVTRRLGSEILHGITRKAVLDLTRATDLEIDERPFSVAEALAAREAFSTSASSFVLPVVEIDGNRIGDGKPGPATQRLRTLYLEKALAG